MMLLAAGSCNDINRQSAPVDLVVTSDDRAALAPAIDVVPRGRRVLVVLRSSDARTVQRVCRRLCRAANADDRPATISQRFFLKPATARAKGAPAITDSKASAGVELP